MKNNFIKLSGILGLITLAAALILAGINAVTEERIAAASEKASQEAMISILKDADTFESLSENISVGKKDGKTVGYCVTVTTKGFGGDIEMMVGMNDPETVLGIEILDHSETPGLGAKAATDSFKNQFSEKSSFLTVVKTPTDSPDEISAITGATITSRAVTQGVKDASELLRNELAGEEK